MSDEADIWEIYSDKIADIWAMKQRELCFVYHGEEYKNYTERVSTKLPRIYHAKLPERYKI